MLVFKDGAAQPYVDRRKTLWSDMRYFGMNSEANGEDTYLLSEIPSGVRFDIDVGSTYLVWVWKRVITQVGPPVTGSIAVTWNFIFTTVPLIAVETVDPYWYPPLH